MRPGVSLIAVGHASSLFLAITFALCVAFDLLFRAGVGAPVQRVRGAHYQKGQHRVTAGPATRDANTASGTSAVRNERRAGFVARTRECPTEPSIT